MGEAPERIWKYLQRLNANMCRHGYSENGPVEGAEVNTSYTRTDLYDEAVRQRDEAMKALRAISNTSGPNAAGQARAFARVTIAACEGSEAG